MIKVKKQDTLRCLVFDFYLYFIIFIDLITGWAFLGIG